jgi:hypothetical protein
MGWLAVGCLVPESLVDRTLDRDGDGHLTLGADGGDDCDDSRASAHPGAAEVCGNAADDDCDGAVDEEGENGLVVYVDADADGFGDAARVRVVCVLSPGFVQDATDCDDANATVFPEADEVCNGRDDDCDRAIDDGAVRGRFFEDVDGDGVGGPEVVEACEPPGPTWTLLGGDCDDAEAQVLPGAVDPPYDGVDQDCAGDDDHDADGDGFPAASGAVLSWPDCDDADASIFPGAPETLYDGVDQDCDPSTEWDADRDAVPFPEDCDEANAAVGRAFSVFPDRDADGWGDGAAGTLACVLPPYAAARAGDCDDRDAAVHAGAVERCNGVDDDCDGAVDAGLLVLVFPDADLDGWGDESLGHAACAPGPRESLRPGDCDDAAPTTHPTASERCNQADDDCDGALDEGLGVAVWSDLDRDGFGEVAEPRLTCAPLPTDAFLTGDCDDANRDVAPGVAEVCDGVDQDCDGAADEGVQAELFADADGDGFGDIAQPIVACPGAAVSANGMDCDDADAGVRPWAVERCNDVDDDCDGAVDDGLIAAWFADVDQDGFGDADALPTFTCAPEVGATRVVGDCDDRRGNVHPYALETCDGLDNDCDPASVEARLTVWPDADGDGHAAFDAEALSVCAVEPGMSRWRDDCDDADASRAPDRAETCDGVDNDCDGVVDEGVSRPVWADADGDGHGDPSTLPLEACTVEVGWSAVGDDCDDGDREVHPDRAEVCDGLDQDCDGVVDEGVQLDAWPDADFDGHGDVQTDAVPRCSIGAGWSPLADDCDDDEPRAHAGATERCDGLDNDCDGDVDDGVRRLLWRDRDADGWGDAGASATWRCPAVGFVERGSDCDDANGAVHPLTPEVCDNVDGNCNGIADEPLVDTWADADRDGWGAQGAPTRACPVGLRVGRAGDCNDGDARVSPSAPEICDAVDNNCDGAAGGILIGGRYADRDGDGVGAGAAMSVCELLGTSTRGDDCDDRDAGVYPGRMEACDGRDEDCDAAVDEGLTVSVWSDGDGDGFGAVGSERQACAPAALEVLVGGDCADADPNLRPGVLDGCDGVDEDCDGALDEDPEFTFYADVDADGFGDADAPFRACGAGAGVVDGTDCDDGDPEVWPAHAEVCDGVDNDCAAATEVDLAGTSAYVCAGWVSYVDVDSVIAVQRGTVSWDRAQQACAGLGYGAWLPDTSGETFVVGSLGASVGAAAVWSGVAGGCSGGIGYFDGATCAPLSSGALAATGLGAAWAGASTTGGLAAAWVPGFLVGRWTIAPTTAGYATACEVPR